MRDDLSTAGADLYRLPRDEFTAARNELAKRLRGDGQRDEAEKVRSLRKPTAAAWIVNRVSREARSDLKKLLAAGERMREARTPAELRQASAREREAITRLLGRVEEIAGSQSAATIERVRETLHAAAGDPEVGALVSAGCLDKEQRLVGFGGAALIPEDRGEKRDAAPARSEQRRQRREREAAQREREQAERSHERALAEAQGAQTELERAEKRLHEAREREQELSA